VQYQDFWFILFYFLLLKFFILEAAGTDYRRVDADACLRSFYGDFMLLFSTTPCLSRLVFTCL